MSMSSEQTFISVGIRAVLLRVKGNSQYGSVLRGQQQERMQSIASIPFSKIAFIEDGPIPGITIIHLEGKGEPLTLQAPTKLVLDAWTEMGSPSKSGFVDLTQFDVEEDLNHNTI